MGGKRPATKIRLHHAAGVLFSLQQRTFNHSGPTKPPTSISEQGIIIINLTIVVTTTTTTTTITTKQQVGRPIILQIQQTTVTRSSARRHRATFSPVPTPRLQPRPQVTPHHTRTRHRHQQDGVVYPRPPSRPFLPDVTTSTSRKRPPPAPWVVYCQNGIKTTASKAISKSQTSMPESTPNPPPSSRHRPRCSSTRHHTSGPQLKFDSPLSARRILGRWDGCKGAATWISSSPMATLACKYDVTITRGWMPLIFKKKILFRIFEQKYEMI